MSFFRRLQAPPNPLLEQYTAATGRPAADAVGDTAAQPFEPIDITPWQPIFAALAFFADHPGAPHHTDPGFPTAAAGEI